MKFEVRSQKIKTGAGRAMMFTFMARQVLFSRAQTFEFFQLSAARNLESHPKAGAFV
jgi:hypothetical protein